MSRTYRKNPPNNCLYRNPKTKNEISQIDAIMNDPDLKDYKLAKVNRMHRHIPTAWDDIVVACHNEIKYLYKND